MSTHWVDFARVVVLLEGGFALGLSATVLVLYMRLRWASSHKPIYFVPLITMAHVLLIVAIEAEIVQHVWSAEPFEWWLSPFAAIGFALSTWATVEMLRSKHLRRLSNDVEGHGWYR